MKSKFKKTVRVIIATILSLVNIALNFAGLKQSRSLNMISSPKGKNNQQKSQKHYSQRELIRVRSSQNSTQFFIATIFNFVPPDFFRKGVEAIPKPKPWKQIFVNTILFVNLAMPELSGSPKLQSNKNLVLEHVVIPVVNWSGKGKTSEWKINDIQLKKTKLTSNADFPIPWDSVFTTLTQVGTDIATANTRLQERLLNLPHSSKNLKDAIKVLKDEADNWCMMVKLKVKTVSPDEGVRICNDAGFEHKIIAIRRPRKNGVKPMNQPGWVQVEGEGSGGRDWQFSFDPFNGEIINLEYTTGGVTTYNAGKSKADVWFRWRLVLRKGKHSDWSEWFKGETP